jgi:hypothetical protein
MGQNKAMNTEPSIGRSSKGCSTAPAGLLLAFGPIPRLSQRRKDAKGIAMFEWLVALRIPLEKDGRSLARRFSAQSLDDSGLHRIGLPHDLICNRMRSLLLYDAFGFPPLRLCVFA